MAIRLFVQSLAREGVFEIDAQSPIGQIFSDRPDLAEVRFTDNDGRLTTYRRPDA